MVRCRWSAARWRQRANPLHPILLGLEEQHFGRRNYTKLIATTERVRQDLERLYRVPSEDVVIIPNGFSATEFNPDRRAERRAQMREELGLRDEETVLLFVANELERKGFHSIMKALRILGKESFRLVVAGRVSAREVMRSAAAFKLSEKVIVTGPTEDVAAYHAAADVFVLPTQYEAFCLAILEALGSGLPVVTSDVPGARDAISEGVNGLLVRDPSSGEELAASVSLMLDAEYRQNMSESASHSVEQYQWPRVLEKYEAVLRDNCR